MNGEKRMVHIIDNHVHVGWYSDGYHSPQEVWNAITLAGIDEIAVSSTSTCAEKYKLVVREMRELQRMGGNKVHPILWLTPKMLRTYGIRYMLHSKIKWEGVKMHWLAHPEWGKNEKLLNKGLKIVKQLGVPLLLHSGNQACCQPYLYEPICRNMPCTKIIIAHGRPIDQTLDLLRNFENVMVDTAFMPVDDAKKIISEGFASRIFFGTDTPIQMMYTNHNTPLSTIIKDNINDFKGILSDNMFDRCPYYKNKEYGK